MAENSMLASDTVAAPAKRAGLFANYNLRLLWAGESISLLGDQFYMVALPWLVLQLTGSAIAVGTILAVAGIPRALFMLVGGAFTDRLSPRMLMLLSNALRIVITGLLTLLVAANMIQVWMLYMFSLAFGVVDAFFHPAYMAMIPQIVEEDELAASNATLQGTSLLVSAVGPGIGGALIKSMGIAFSFLLDTVSFVAATFTLLLMKPTREQAKPDKHFDIIADIHEAIDYIVKDDLLRPFMLIVMALNFLFVGPLMVGPAIMAKERFMEGSVALGVLLSAMGVGSLIGMLAGSMLKPTRLGIVTLSSVAVAGLSIVAAGYAPSLWLTAVLFGVAGFSGGFSNLLLITWLQRRISKEMMGRVMSIVMLSSMGLMPISSAVSGFIAEYNLTLLFVLNGALLVVTVIVSLMNRNVRTMRA
ncbi:MAG: MFS transporter [Anaerolineae bacterium]|nr:MFS transporter [Anaerolineae bacterium]